MGGAKGESGWGSISNLSFMAFATYCLQMSAQRFVAWVSEVEKTASFILSARVSSFREETKLLDET